MSKEFVSSVSMHAIAKCGGVAVVKEWLGISRGQVYKFFAPKSRGGTGGCIPVHHQRMMLQRAAAAHIPLTAEDFHEPPHGRAVWPPAEPDQKGAQPPQPPTLSDALSAPNACSSSSLPSEDPAKTEPAAKVA